MQAGRVLLVLAEVQVKGQVLVGDVRMQAQLFIGCAVRQQFAELFAEIHRQARLVALLGGGGLMQLADKRQFCLGQECLFLHGRGLYQALELL